MENMSRECEWVEGRSNLRKQGREHDFDVKRGSCKRPMHLGKVTSPCSVE